MTIDQIQETIVDEFGLYDEWLDKYAYLIELGKSLAPYPDTDKQDKYLIQGCQSRVWLKAAMADGKVVYTADSDAIITKGIVSLLIRVFSGQTPQDIAKAEITFIDRIGLRENLSPTRANGLLAMLKQIKWYAVALANQ